MTPADKDIRELTERLGLRYERQDWGICNANPGRTAEFIQVCRTGALTLPQQYAMGELVLASMNEAIAIGTADEDLVGKFKSFLTLDLHGLAPQIQYWASLADPEEFPLVELLGRELVA